MKKLALAFIVLGFAANAQATCGKVKKIEGFPNGLPNIYLEDGTLHTGFDRTMPIVIAAFANNLSVCFDSSDAVTLVR